MKDMVQKSYFKILLIFIIIGTTIIFKSITNIDGYLSPDSCNYLRLAQNLLNKNSFYINTLDGEKFFAVWPIGYPTMIFLVAKLTGLSVFFASKVLNIIFIGLIFYVFHKNFKENSWLFALMFLTIGFIDVFSYTWSEVPFIFGLLWFALAILKFNESEDKYLLYSSNITLVILFLFMNRYIGAFSIGVVGLLFIYLIYIKAYRKSFYLLIPIFIGTIFVSLYLYHNILTNGYATGMPRIPAPENFAGLIVMTIRALVSELNLLAPHFNIVTFIFEIVVFYWFFLRFKPFQNEKGIINNTWKFFMIIGLLYYGAIILMRMRSHFDNLGVRLMIPGTFLIIVGIITYLQDRLSQEHFNNFKKAFLIIVATSYVLAVKPIAKKLIDNQPFTTYYENIREIEDKTKDIPQNSILIFNESHHLYLRNDLFYTTPRYLPYFAEQDKWDDFVNKLKSKYYNKEIYVLIPHFKNEVDEQTYKDRFHSSVYEFIKNNQHLDIVKLN